MKNLKIDTGERRIVPVCHELVNEIASFLIDLPEMQGQVMARA